MASMISKIFLLDVQKQEFLFSSKPEKSNKVKDQKMKKILGKKETGFPI